jgi:hypothetical protein
MTMTLTKINRNSVSLAGEFAALSQLALRGYDANMTLVSNEVCRYSCLKSCQAAFGRYGCTKSSTTDSKDGNRVRLYSRPRNDLTYRFH